MAANQDSTPIARKIMTEKLFTIQEDESLMTAWRLMRDRRIRHLPVTSATSGVIIGILTDRDLQRAIHTEFDQAGAVRFTVEKFAVGETVSDYMSNPPRYVSVETPIVTVATQMLEQKISCLLVTENDEVVGIVTTDDLLWSSSECWMPPKNLHSANCLLRSTRAPLARWQDDWQLQAYKEPHVGKRPRLRRNRV